MHDVLPTFASLAGAGLPAGRKLDGIDASGVWLGKEGAQGHEVFHYFRGFELQAIRRGAWKLHFGTAAPPKEKGKAGQRPVGLALFNLDSDPGEKTNVAEANPGVVKALQALAAAMDADLGIGVESQGPGVRPLGRVENPLPFLDHEGRPRPDALGRQDRFP
jgi:arylsulfatase A-like enzyme